MKATRFVYYIENSFLPEPIAMYRDKLGSDVSGETLTKRGEAIPLTPTFRTWVNLISQKKRCPRCYTTLRGSIEDFVRHSGVHKSPLVKA